MKYHLYLCAALLSPLLAFGDTLIMKDGSRFNGRFTSGDGRVINFTEANGNRQSLNMYDVQELRFGAVDAGYRSADPVPGVAASELRASLDRLESDVRIALDNSNLPEDQRRSLRESRITLSHAMQLSQAGQALDRAAVRQALDNVRAAVNDPSVRQEDRERVLSDLDRARGMFPGMNDDRFGRGRNF